MRNRIRLLQFRSNYRELPFLAGKYGPPELSSIPLDLLECVKPNRTSVQDRHFCLSSVSSKEEKNKGQYSQLNDFSKKKLNDVRVL